MADLRISELPLIGGGDVQPAVDVLAVADISASETKKVTATSIAQAALGSSIADGGLANAIILADKINWSSLTDESIGGSAITINTLPGDRLVDGSVTSAQVGELKSINLEDGAVVTAKILDLSVTTEKIADTAVTGQKLATDAAVNNISDGSLNGSKILGASIDGQTKLMASSVTATQLGANSVTTGKIASFAVDAARLADNAVTTRSLSSNVIDPFGGLVLNANGIAVDNSIVAGAYGGITYNEQGVITAVDPSGLIPASDLPLATTTDIGAVSVPLAGGLSVSGAGELSHTNLIADGSFAGFTYDAHGHITSVVDSGLVPSGSLPAAGTTPDSKGAVYVSGTGNLRVLGDGKLEHISTVVAGSYAKVTVDASGHVQAGLSLSSSDLPDITADKIVGGTLNPDLLGDRSVTREMLADYSIAYIQEAEPTSLDPGHVGCLWFQESTAQLRMWNSNSWMPVGFGRLSQDNLRWGGLVDASTDTVTVVTEAGTTAGLVVGNPLPVSTDALGGLYVIADVAGNGISVTPSETYTIGDWCLCINEDQGWTRLDVAAGGGGGGGLLKLDDLVNVQCPTPVDGDFLLFDVTSNEWINAAEINCGTF